MSPGGSTPSSSRSCPELPPLSNMVTTALSCSHGLCFSPPRRLGNPVPPPKQPTFSWRKRIADIVVRGPWFFVLGPSLVLGPWSLTVAHRTRDQGTSHGPGTWDRGP